jgi:hypothetical protein
VSFKVRTQMRTEFSFFIFRSGLARGYCIALLPTLCL